MKKKIEYQMLLVIIALATAMFISIPAQAAPPAHPSATVMDMRPDLRADLILHFEGFTRPDGTYCYRTGPVCRVTNLGRSVARSFRIKVYMMKQGAPAWQFFDQETVSALKPGKIHARDWGTGNVWCPDRPGKIGFRMMVDADKQVSETNETNNSDQVIYGGGKIKALPKAKVRFLQH